jgi:hypothetical protein
MKKESIETALNMADKPSNKKKSASLINTIKSLKPSSDSDANTRQNQPSKCGFAPPKHTASQQKKENETDMARGRNRRKASSDKEQNLSNEFKRQQLKYDRDMEAEEREEQYYEELNQTYAEKDESDKLNQWFKQKQETEAILYDHTGKLIDKNSASYLKGKEQKELTPDPWDTAPAKTQSLDQALSSAQQIKQQAAQELAEDRKNKLHQMRNTIFQEDRRNEKSQDNSQQERVITVAPRTESTAATAPTSPPPAAPTASAPPQPTTKPGKRQRDDSPKSTAAAPKMKIRAALSQDIKRFTSIATAHMIGTILLLPKLLLLGSVTGLILMAFLAADLWLQQKLFGFETPKLIKRAFS